MNNAIRLLIGLFGSIHILYTSPQFHVFPLLGHTPVMSVSDIDGTLSVEIKILPYLCNYV